MFYLRLLYFLALLRGYQFNVVSRDKGYDEDEKRLEYDCVLVWCVGFEYRSMLSTR
jgi:hypothetical protein